jgi:hypothetical protein
LDSSTLIPLRKLDIEIVAGNLRVSSSGSAEYVDAHDVRFGGVVQPCGHPRCEDIFQKLHV